MLYADCLEKQFGQRPLIFYSNGYEHWLWDDAFYPPRPVQGFYTRDELKLAIDRRTTRKPLDRVPTDAAIAERYYQERAIRKVAAALERKQRKALLVMATGSGKTRTVIALSDVLQRANWVKRVLFLADRNALVKQAVGNFKKHLPASSPVNLVTEREQEGRVYVSTYQTMMGLIDEMKGGPKAFWARLLRSRRGRRSSPFDLPEIRRHLRVLRCTAGWPHSHAQGRGRQQHLPPLRAGKRSTDRRVLTSKKRSGQVARTMLPYSLQFQFPRQGIVYDDLSDEEKAEWDELEWDEDGGVPDRVNAEAINRWLFNEDTVDKVLEHLMTHGHKVAGGDRLGKTIIFAKNHDHAEFIARAVRRELPALCRAVCAGDRLSGGVRAEPDRQLFRRREEPAHRHLGRHARHGHRCARDRQPCLLQAGKVEDEVLANGGPWNTALPRSLRSWQTTSRTSTSSMSAATLSSSANRRPQWKLPAHLV